jgi:hypothetical protein
MNTYPFIQLCTCWTTVAVCSDIDNCQQSFSVSGFLYPRRINGVTHPKKSREGKLTCNSGTTAYNIHSYIVQSARRKLKHTLSLDAFSDKVYFSAKQLARNEPNAQIKWSQTQIYSIHKFIVLTYSIDHHWSSELFIKDDLLVGEI